MKQLLTTLAFLVCHFTISEAQETFQFTDLQGNPVADGSVITVKTLNSEGQMVVPLRVKNVLGQKAAVSMFETIDDKPHGDWQTCAFGNCMTLDETGYSPKNIMSADYDAEIQTEWIPETGKYASWTATLQIHVFNIKTTMSFGKLIEKPGDEVIEYGPTVTVHFVYDDPAGISTPNQSRLQKGSNEVYNLNGQRVQQTVSGLYIKNGKKVKK